MPPLDFPSSPSNGQTCNGPGGVVWSWDGAKWVNGSTGVATAVPQTLNYADNSGFSVNQRGYASGVALAAAAYGFDRWKAGAGGATLTFTASAPSTVVTITAGTLQQVVDGVSIQGGNYMLSWTGTAQGRVGAGAYAASPVAVTGITAGANTTIEFNTGTLSRVKFESGTVATPWATNAARYELANCQRFFQTGQWLAGSYGIASGSVWAQYVFPVVMRGTPIVTPAANTGANSTYASVVGSPAYALWQGTAVTTTAYQINATFTASADL
jgi:hypothetical protein